MKIFLKFIQSNFVFFIALLLSLIPVTWFYNHPGQLINGVDTNFPLNPILWWQKRFFVWNDDLNGGVDFASSISGLFFHFVQVVVYFLSHNLYLTELVSFVFWFGLILLSALYFIRSIVKNPLAQIAFIVLYAFNIYMFNSWENVKVANLSLIAATPLFIGVYVNLIQNRISFRRSTLYSLFLSFILSGSGINPAYFIVFLLIGVLFFVFDLITQLKVKDIIYKSKRFFALISIIILANTYWILPTINYIFSNINPSGSIDKVGYNNWVDSLSENTSLLNILRMQGAWDWYSVDGITGQPLYIPYALNYFHNPVFIVYGFLIVFLGILSLVSFDRERKSLYISFGTMFVIGVFMGAGTHLPTGSLYRSLSNAIPFFTLFRSPWYIFTPLVSFSTAGLISLLVDKSFKYSIFKSLRGKLVLVIGIVIFIAGNLFYSYPLITGKIFRPQREDGFYISFPDYVQKTGDWLATQNDLERILVYPDDEIEKFKWKYRGVESILQLLSDKEFVYPPLNATDIPVVKLVKKLYFDLKTDSFESARNIGQKLVLRSIFEKTDQESLSPELPSDFKKNNIISIGKWNFIGFPQDGTNKMISSPGKIVFGSDKVDDNVEISSITSKDEVIVNPKDTEVSKIENVGEYSGQVLLATNNQKEEYIDFTEAASSLKNRLFERDLSKAEFTINVTQAGDYFPVLEKRSLSSFGINESGDLKVKVNGIPTIWKVARIGQSYIYYDKYPLEAGENKVELKLSNINLVQGGDFKGTQMFEKSGEGEYKVLGDSTEQYLSIWNNYPIDAKALFQISDFDPASGYMIQLKYKQIYGNNASVIVGQNNSQTLVKVQVERLPNYPEWGFFSFYYQPVFTSSKTEVGLLAPETKDPLGTKIFYGDLQVYKVFMNNMLFIKDSVPGQLSQANITYIKKSPVLYEGKVENGSLPHILAFYENYSKGWELEITNSSGNKIKPDIIHFSADLYANAWYIKNAPDTYSFRIVYTPQRIFYFGTFISLLVLLIVITYNLLGKFLRRVNV